MIVNGPPASGKTTLARHLAREFRLALLEKDTVKERLYDTLGAGDLVHSRALRRASIAVLLALAEQTLAAGASVIVEATSTRSSPARRWQA